MADSSKHTHEQDSYWGNPPQTPEAHPRSGDGQKPSASRPPEPPQGVGNPEAQEVAEKGLQAAAVSGEQNRSVTSGEQAGSGEPAAVETQEAQDVNDVQETASLPGQTPLKKKHTTAVIVGIVAAAVLVVGIAGCALGTFAFRTFTDNVVQNQQNGLSQNDQDNDEPFALEQSDLGENNEEFRRYYGLYASEDDSPITESELSDLAAKLKSGQASGQAAGNAAEKSDTQSDGKLSGKAQDKSDKKDSIYQPGVYYVGKDLPAGMYWIQGDENSLSYYFALSSAHNNAAGASYNVWMVNHYYGNSIVEVAEGDVLVINKQAQPVEQVKQQFTAPYKSGVYRVGVDIPEGTYTLSAGSAHDYYAYYIMSNATYKGACYLAYDNSLNVNYHPTITLKAGTYLELYNVTMKSNTV